MLHSICFAFNPLKRVRVAFSFSCGEALLFSNGFLLVCYRTRSSSFLLINSIFLAIQPPKASFCGLYVGEHF